jgi:S-ribosylhomocysteine lyase LuxS involved in autoinducer biosynthesis
MRERIATWPSNRANRFSVRAPETLTANRVLTLEEIERWQVFTFDPGGAARNVDLPPVAAAAGAYLVLANTADALEVITVRDAAAATVVTPTQAEACLVWCDGTRWYGLVGAFS